MNKKGYIGTVIIIAIILILIGLTFFYLVRLKEFNTQKQTVESIEIKQSIVDELNELFGISNTEFVLCLTGKIENNVAIIETTSIPEEVQSKEKDIIFSSCNGFDFLQIFKNERHLGTIHNHQSGVCSLGFQDTYTFGRTNDAIAGIICGTDNINFFTSKSLIESLETKNEDDING